MNPFVFVYVELLFRPLFNLLVGITNVLPSHNIGIAIIFVTLVVRIILLPPSLQQARQAQKNQEKMPLVQKKIKEIQKQHKDDKSAQAQATMQVYKEAGINPAAGCLPLLVQLPILLALYRVFFLGVGEDTYHNLYGFVSRPESIATVFLGIPLTEPSLVLGVIAGVAQFVLMKYFTNLAAAPAANETSAQMMKAMQQNMTYLFPVMTVFIALQLPAALALYWVATTIFAIVQQYFIRRTMNVAGTMPAV